MEEGLNKFIRKQKRINRRFMLFVVAAIIYATVQNDKLNRIKEETKKLKS